MRSFFGFVKDIIDCLLLFPPECVDFKFGKEMIGRVHGELRRKANQKCIDKYNKKIKLSSEDKKPVTDN